MEKEIENLKFQVEIESVKRERAIRSLFEERIQSLEQELKQKTDFLHEKTLIASEVETLRDEIDLLRPTAEKVSKLENSLIKYKQKVEELGAIKEKCRVSLTYLR
jgi:predicted nuclease with TOPRIM domain